LEMTGLESIHKEGHSVLRVSKIHINTNNKYSMILSGCS
jgi:hypothetical protein